MSVQNVMAIHSVVFQTKGADQPKTHFGICMAKDTNSKNKKKKPIYDQFWRAYMSAWLYDSIFTGSQLTKG